MNSVGIGTRRLLGGSCHEHPAWKPVAFGDRLWPIFDVFATIQNGVGRRLVRCKHRQLQQRRVPVVFPKVLQRKKLGFELQRNLCTLVMRAACFRSGLAILVLECLFLKEYVKTNVSQVWVTKLTEKRVGFRPSVVYICLNA